MVIGAVEQTFAFIKPDGMSNGHKEAILNQIQARGYKVVRSIEKQLAREEAASFYDYHVGQVYYEQYATFMSSGPVLIMILEGENIIEGWREMMGPTNPIKARRDAPMSIRAKYGSMTTRNAVHGSSSETSARRGIDFFF
ncbi:nucleoside diphosphate kinase, partial [Dimargaris cristalligena]